MLSRPRLGTCREMNSYATGNTRSQSSQLAEPLWTDPDQKSEINVRELISTLKKKKKKERRQEINGRTLS